MTDQSFENTEENTEQKSFVKRLREKSSSYLVSHPLLSGICRIFSYGFLALVFSFLLLIFLAGRYLKGDTIPENLISLVENQTGGRVSIGVSKFNILTGLELSSIEFYPLQNGENKSFSNGGAIAQVR